jgi:hypothetical protein
VAEALTGYVSIDLLLEVASGLGALPGRTVTVEVEPARLDPCDRLSPQAEAGLEQALELVRAEVGRAPLLEHADRLREAVAGERLEPSPALTALEDLLEELDLLEREGRWGRTFAERDRLRLCISLGETGEGMETLDWGLWWGLIEELDRLERVEALGSLHRP